MAESYDREQSNDPRRVIEAQEKNKLILLVWVAGLTRRRSHEGNRFLVWKTNRKSVTVSPRGQICPSGSLCDF